MGDEFMSGDGESVELDALRGEGKVIGLYFSAHWCPPCKAFTPKLVETYNKVKAAGKQLEIVFVSSDRDMKQFQEYFATMPWLAIPPGDKRKAALSARFEVEGIPSLVFIDGATGETINANGRAAVGADPEGEEFPWQPKALNDMAAGADGLNDEACVCVMMEGVSAKAQAALAEAMGAHAEAAKAAGGRAGRRPGAQAHQARRGRRGAAAADPRHPRRGRLLRPRRQGRPRQRRRLCRQVQGGRPRAQAAGLRQAKRARALREKQFRPVQMCVVRVASEL